MGADENNASQSNAVNTYFFLKVDDRPAVTSPTPVPTVHPGICSPFSGDNELTISFNQPVLRSSVVSGNEAYFRFNSWQFRWRKCYRTLTPALSSDRKLLHLLQ